MTLAGAFATTWGWIIYWELVEFPAIRAVPTTSFTTSLAIRTARAAQAKTLAAPAALGPAPLVSATRSA